MNYNTVYVGMDVHKELYLVMIDITKKWIGHRQDWGQIHFQLVICFEERLSDRNL